VEFQDRNWIRKNVNFTRFINTRSSIKVLANQIAPFIKNYHEWDYTDDTEMTIGTMKALISDKEFSRSLLIKKWSKEYFKGVKDKGYERNGHGSMSWYYSKEKTIEEIRDFQRDRPNPGNAPAMRAAPIGLIKEEFINKYAAINANPTHPNINAILSSQCIARAARFMLIEKGNLRDIIHYCQQTISLNEEYENYLSKVNQLGNYDDFKLEDFEMLCGHQPIKKPYFLSGIHGIPSDSKYTAGAVLFILKNSQTAMEALKKSIYLGGDVDSVASITTGILAAKTGLDSLPSFMLENVEGKAYLIEIAKQFEETIKQ
jgi:ADP-ribosylglycohydrolase